MVLRNRYFKRLKALSLKDISRIREFIDKNLNSKHIFRIRFSDKTNKIMIYQDKLLPSDVELVIS